MDSVSQNVEAGWYRYNIICLVSSTTSHTIFGQISICQYIHNTWLEFKTVKFSTRECECSYFSRSFIMLIEEPL